MYKIKRERENSDAKGDSDSGIKRTREERISSFHGDNKERKGSDFEYHHQRNTQGVRKKKPIPKTLLEDP